MEPHISEETRLNRSMIEAGEGSPTFRDEILTPDVLQPAAALTPVLQSLSGSKRKRTPTHEGTTYTKKAAMDTDTRRPTRSAPATKKKATVDTGTGRPAPSATLLPPPPKIPHSSATNSKAGQE